MLIYIVRYVRNIAFMRYVFLEHTRYLYFLAIDSKTITSTLPF